MKKNFYNFRISFAAFFFLLVYILVPGEAAAQVKQEWLAKSNEGPGERRLYSKMVVDSAGNSYVTSNKFTSDQSQNILTIKYSAKGEVLWQKEYHSTDDVPNDIVLDAAGNVYVTGYSSGADTYRDMITIKYKPDGAQAWVARYDMPYDVAYGKAIVVDNSGAVYVVGQISNRINGGIVLLKYDQSNGNELWQSPFIYTGMDDDPFENYEAEAIALDDAGDVYVAGAKDDRDVYMFTAKFSGTNGKVVWSRLYDTGDIWSTANAIAVDKAGGVYITGTDTFGSEYTIAYNAADGTQKWVKSHRSASISDGIGGRDIIADDAGNVFVAAGVTPGDDLTTGVFKYNAATGEELWAKGFGSERFNSVALDNKGGLYITSLSMTTVKLDAGSGEQLWAVTPGSRYGGLSTTLALDDANNVYVNGIGSADGNLTFIATLKYSPGENCSPLAQVPITETNGTAASKVAVGTSAVYTITVEGATTYNWRIKDRQEKILKTGSKSSIEMMWPEAGFYTIYLTYGNACDKKTVEHKITVYDTNAGLVAGGGWFTSGVNKVLPYMQVAEKAYFGFAALYPNGSTEVLGKTVVVLRKNKMEFVSSEHEPMRLLVYGGDKANYTGRGTINGKGNYGILVAAVDGNLSSGTQADKLRIRIWDEATGKTVYDNQPGGCECAIATTDIGAGAIVIYKGDLNLQFTSPQVAEAFKYVEPVKEHFYNYPNIFSTKTTLSFAVQEEGDFELEVFDMKGQSVQKISAGKAVKGQVYEYEFDGSQLEPGIYIARLTNGTSTQSIKLMLRR